MKKIFKLSAMIILAMVVLTGCRTANVYNVNNAPLQNKLSSEKVYDAIKMAGYKKGWIITKVKPGLAMGKISLRTHQAMVEIPYTAKSFSIVYKNSVDLKYDSAKGTIHKNYNGWVRNLEQAIDFEITALNNKNK